MARYLMVSDFHNDLAAWTWLKKACRKFDAVFYAGDFFSANEFSLPILNLIKIRSKYLAELETTFYCCTGNHDWDESITDVGLGYWLRNLGEKYPHIKTAGIHSLADNWQLQIVDWMEPACTIGECAGPSTILLQHVPPSGPCSIQNGCDWGDPLLAAEIEQDGPTLLCAGHTHLPNKNMHRQGHSLVLNPGVSTGFGGNPNHIVIDTNAGTCVWHGNDRQGKIVSIYPR